ncbi:hypothetical protein ACQ4PT_053280 [Festuca glaucescens]
MSGGGGGGGRGPSAAAGPVPASVRKLVQGLKEIVSRPDAEIYAALRDCGMDPDEAVSRLLSQDTFQEVKNKRDKKKEVNKGTPEPRPRGTNNSSRATRGGTDRANRSSSVQSVSSGADNMASRSSILGPGVPSTNSSQKLTVPSSFVSKDAVPDVSFGALQPSSGFQQNWCGVPGQMSMADIVKMGRPQGRSSSKPTATTEKSFADQNPSSSKEANLNSKQSASTALPTTFDQRFPALPDPIPRVLNSSHASADSHQTHENVWFPQDELPSRRQLTAPEPSGDPSLSAVSFESPVLVDAADLHEKPHAEDNTSTVMQTAIPSGRHLEVLHDNSQFIDGLLQNSSTYQSQMHSYDDEVEVCDVDVESAATNFQHLRLQNEDLAVANSGDDNPAVIIPDHLQLENTDCAHLSFGSFESGAFSGLLPSKVPKYGAEEVPIPDEESVDQIDGRNQDYYDSGALHSSANEDVEARIGTNTENIDVPSVSQPDILMQGALDVSGLQYNPPSVSDHVYQNTTQPSIVESQQGNTQAQHLSHFSSFLQANPMQNNFVGSNLTSHRDFDFSPFLSPQSAMKYNPAVPTTNYPISMQENLSQGGFSNTRSTQNFPSTSIPSGPPHPQQLPVHPYPQSALPLGPFASLVGYPYLPQNFYIPPPTFQQAYASNGPFHQSGGGDAALPESAMKYSMPQYKSSLPATSVPQHSPVVSGYGGFGSSSNIPNFGQNQSAPSPAAAMGIDEALSAQFKEANHYMALQQQSDNSAMWLHGAAGSRAVSAVPPGNLYGFHGQSTQGGFRQAQQPSQYGGLGYPSFYQSQAGMPQELPQNPVEGRLNSSQTAPSQPSHQMWQHSY